MSDLARRQLADLERASQGAITVEASAQQEGLALFQVGLDTRAIQTAEGGITVRARHRFDIYVDDRFPYYPPTVLATHRRWAGTPHVQWGRQLCLYAAPSVEWDPADGMRGLIERLISWLERAAAGTLDAEAGPLHPPIAYTKPGAGWVIINPNLGELVPWHSHSEQEPAHTFVHAWCQRIGNRFEVVEWLTADQVYDRLLAPDFTASDANGRPYVVVPALLVSAQWSTEFPARAAELVATLQQHGVDEAQILRSLTRTSVFNATIAAAVNPRQRHVDQPTVLILGTPSRRINGTVRLCHLTAWRLSEMGARVTRLLARVEDRDDELADDIRDTAAEWLTAADIDWMDVYDSRPEVTIRRDVGSASNWIAGRNVLVLGCGALGAPLAEHCVRSGARALTVIDAARVKPGILVRQPYVDADIGFSKAHVLAKRLRAIYPAIPVAGKDLDIVSALVENTLQPVDFDLVIDTTADVSVRAALESTRAPQRSNWPPLITCVIGHDAQRGVVTVTRPGATGGGRDILRRLAIHAWRRAGEWRDVAEDLFPHPPRTELFSPEPGCSAPTFTGSSMQTEALAAKMLWSAAGELADDESVDPMCAIVVRMPKPDSVPAQCNRAGWTNDIVLDDRSGRFEVRLTASAVATMRAEARRGARVRHAAIETGGMLLGSVDEAARCVYVDVATGPPPDSVLTDQSFDFGTEGNENIIARYQRDTCDNTGFLGMWHTHPGGPAAPSPRDKASIATLAASGITKWNLAVIAGGDQARWNRWLTHGDTPDIYAQVTDEHDPTGTAEPSPPVPMSSSAVKFAGGFSAESIAEARLRRHWWKRLRWIRRGTAS